MFFWGVGIPNKVVGKQPSKDSNGLTVGNRRKNVQRVQKKKERKNGNTAMPKSEALQQKKKRNEGSPKAFKKNTSTPSPGKRYRAYPQNTSTKGGREERKNQRACQKGNREKGTGGKKREKRLQRNRLRE